MGQAMFAQVHFNATDIAAEGGEGPELDPMQAAEQAMKAAEERKRAGGALGSDAKRQRVTADATTARKELLAGFFPAETYEGTRKGYIFKLGVKGLGYYEDASISDLEARSRENAQKERRAAEQAREAQRQANAEEIELDLDLDDDDDDGDAGAPAASSSAPAAPVASNPDEIEEQSIPAEVFGGGLSKVRDAVVAEQPEVEEPPLAEPDAEMPENFTGGKGALKRFHE